MISIIITAFQEPDTIAKAIRSIGEPKYSGLNDDFEILQVSPDQETLDAGKKSAQELGISSRYRQIIDPHKGKPHALNLAFKAAKGDIFILTDGDVYFTQSSLSELLKPLADKRIGAVSGRPISENPKSDFWGYQSHMYADAAHAKRVITLSVEKLEEEKTRNFFPMSGYIFAIRNTGNLKLPTDTVIDDLHISHLIYDQGYSLAYAPKATCMVKFPTSIADTVKQKRRNLIGHQVIAHAKDLKTAQLGVQTRSLNAELKFAYFPIQYASRPIEYIYTLGIFALRAWVWLNIFFFKLKRRSVMSKQGWDRIESTK